eukprot:gene6530-7272_t
MSSSTAVADLGKRLLEASRKGNAEEVRQLMATGAPITTDWLGTSPLHLAAQYGHTVTAEVLLRAGVSRDGKTKVNKTPLHLASQHGHFEIAKLLIKSGATVNQLDMLNMTPLHWAVEAHSQEICRLLMRHGATTDTRNKFGHSAMDIIKSKKYEDLEDILLCTSYGPSDYMGEKQNNNNNTSVYMESRKRARTRKFPMTAGSWTGGEIQSDRGSKSRPKQARYNVDERDNPTSVGLSQQNVNDRNSVANGSNLSSLVDAAVLVRSNAQNNRMAGTIGVDSTQGNISVFSDASVLDTLATLATASTLISTSGSDTIGCMAGTKQASLSNSSLTPSYITIPGLQGPVQILQANSNQPGFGSQNPVASALPAAGIIQLASPLAFNIMSGGRVQVGQPIVSGGQLNIPVQMPLHATGLPGGHYIAVNNTTGAIVSSQSTQGTLGPAVSKQPIVSETLSSRPPTIMSAATQSGVTTAGLSPGNLPVNLPIGLLNSVVGGNVSLASAPSQQQQASLPSNTQSSDPRFLQPKVTVPPISQINLQPGVAPAQLAQAIQYANISPGIAPIPILPVNGLGGLQLLPQVIPAQLFNALRGSLPQSPQQQQQQQQSHPQQQQQQLHPQIASGSSYPITMSPLNLSNILPAAVSLSQLPLAQQQTLAQQVQTNLAQQLAASQTLPQHQTPHIVGLGPSQYACTQQLLSTSQTIAATPATTTQQQQHSVGNEALAAGHVVVTLAPSANIQGDLIGAQQPNEDSRTVVTGSSGLTPAAINDPRSTGNSPGDGESHSVMLGRASAEEKTTQGDVYTFSQQSGGPMNSSEGGNSTSKGQDANFYATVAKESAVDVDGSPPRVVGKIDQGDASSETGIKDKSSTLVGKSEETTNLLLPHFTQLLYKQLLQHQSNMSQTGVIEPARVDAVDSEIGTNEEGTGPQKASSEPSAYNGAEHSNESGAEHEDFYGFLGEDEDETNGELRQNEELEPSEVLNYKDTELEEKPEVKE